MRRITEGTTQNLPDAAEFIELINNPPTHLRNFFDSENALFVARAPGRLDVMGGIADYSGSLVLEMPIREATLAAAQVSSDRKIKIISLPENGGEKLSFEMPLKDFFENGKLISYEKARLCFARNAENQWAAYIAGLFPVLMRECGIVFETGARILIRSKIPLGKGVSSSAALEAAAAAAICAAFDIEIEPREMALLCQKVENLIVGAPCGVMDQMSVVCGTENSLISLLCQPAEILETIEIPAEIEFWGIDSGVRHAVAGADYASVRVGAFMGYRIIADLVNLPVKKNVFENSVEIEDSRWNNYLSNISPAEFEQFFATQIPERIGGAEFLRKYAGTTDSVTKVLPEKIYAVRQPAAHAIYENFRVRLFAELLKNSIDERKLNLLGELMFQSHASYAACGLCEPGTSRLVESVRENSSKNLFGAKITGGGSGGTIAVLALRGSDAAIEEIARKYERESGLQSYVFRGSSPGSFSFGHIKLEKQ